MALHHLGTRRVPEALAELGDGVGGPAVVAVQEGHELAGRLAQATVAGGRWAGIGLATDLRRGQDGPHQLVERLGAAVVDDEHLAAGVDLELDAAQGLGQVAQAAMDRHDHAEPWPAHR